MNNRTPAFLVPSVVLINDTRAAPFNEPAFASLCKQGIATLKKPTQKIYDAGFKENTTEVVRKKSFGKAGARC